MSDWLDDDIVDDGEQSDHALLSPSKAHRWMVCSGSLFAEAGEDEKPSVYAIEGQLAHKVGAAALTERRPASAYIGRIWPDVDPKLEVTDWMAEEVQKYVDSVLAILKAAGPNAALLVEQRVDFSRYVGRGGQFGTADVIIIDPDARELIVDDLKFGKGVEVRAEGNEQEMIYALGALDLVEPIVGCNAFDRVRLIIDQPRRGLHDEWTISVADLRAWAEARLLPRARRALVQYDGLEPPVYTPSEKGCRFCKFAPECPAAAQFAHEAALADFAINPDLVSEPIVREPPSRVEQLALNARKVPFVQAWARAVMAKLEQIMIQQGVEIPGFKVVRGRKGDREWSDTIAVANALSSHEDADVFEPRKLRSPAQMEKQPALKRSSALTFVLNEYVKQADGRLTVVPDSDSRPRAAVSTPTADMINVDTTEIL